MFPDYNAYNQYYGINNLNNGFDYRAMGSNNIMNAGSDEVISINQATIMIRKTINNLRAEDIFLDKLMKASPHDKDKEIIESIRDDSRKHGRILQDIYYSLTGQMNIEGQMPPMPPMPNHAEKSEENDKDEINYQTMLEKILFNKFDNIVKYRKIMGPMPSGENYILLMSILTDELKNIGKLNFLIHTAK